VDLLRTDRRPPDALPSLADVGYLLLPVGALAALWLYPTGPSTAHATIRLLLDGLTAATALFVISWTTALGAVAHTPADSRFGFVVSLAYPVADLGLCTVTLLVLSRAQVRRRAPLLLLGTGLLAMAVADSGFAYLTAVGRYHSGSLIDPRRVADRVLASFEVTFHVGVERLRMRASIGLATDSPELRELTAIELLRYADLAMYQAKNAGKHSLAVYQPTGSYTAEGVAASQS
jgi:hypothetical protein